MVPCISIPSKSTPFAPCGNESITIHENVAWDYLVADAATKGLFKQADAVCFGTLAQRTPASAATIRTLVASTAPEALRIFDVNLRQNQYSAGTVAASLELANVLKLNDAELPEIAAMLGIRGNVREMIAGVLEEFDLRLVAYTRGSAGSVLYDGREWIEHPGIATDVCDTIGAGDSFTAAVALGLLKRWPLATISAAANEVAAHVCSHDGAVPAMPDSIRSRFLAEAAFPVGAQASE